MREWVQPQYPHPPPLTAPASVAGMLLRWFMHLYNLEVCEEEAFLRWREDVTDAYPGKGEALFQVSAPAPAPAPTPGPVAVPSC